MCGIDERPWVGFAKKMLDCETKTILYTVLKLQVEACAYMNLIIGKLFRTGSVAAF